MSIYIAHSQKVHLVNIWACTGKTPTTKTVQTIAWKDQLPLTGRPQMLKTNNVGRWCAAVHQVQWSRSMKTWIHQQGCPLGSELASINSSKEGQLLIETRIPGIHSCCRDVGLSLLVFMQLFSKSTQKF